MFNLDKTETVARGGELFLDFLGANGKTRTIPRDSFIAGLAKHLGRNDQLVYSSTVFNTLWTPPQIQRDSI